MADWILAFGGKHCRRWEEPPSPGMTAGEVVTLRVTQDGGLRRRSGLSGQAGQ